MQLACTGVRRRILAFGLVFLAVGCLMAPTAAARPNVLLIVTDDQRAQGTMRVMPETKQLFGRHGTRFSRAHVTTPLCCPSRATIFSGKYAHNHGVMVNDGSLFDPTDSWQRRLQEEGYRTGLVGKYLHETLTETAPYFDYRFNSPFESPEEPRLIARNAAKFIRGSEREDRRPWALMLAFASPHTPWNVEPKAPCRPGRFSPAPSFGEADLSDKHPSITRRAEVDSWHVPEEVHRGQLCELQATDEAIRRTFRRLGDFGEGGRTLAIFTSDNGFQWGEHRVWRKQLPYRESTHVPLFMRWPGRVPEQAKDHRLVANIDIAPTIFQAARILPGYPLDGSSLLSNQTRRSLLIEATDFTARLDSELYVEWRDGFTEHYSRDDQWQMWASNTPTFEDSAWLEAARNCIGATCP